MSKGLFAKKTIKSLIDEAAERKSSMKRTLGPLNLTMMGIGAIIGGGIFVMTGQAAAQYAGPGIVPYLCFSGLCLLTCGSLLRWICLASADCRKRLLFYAYATMGEFVAWTIGWCVALEYLFSSSTVAVGWSAYFVSLLRDWGITIPSAFSQAPLAYDPVLGWQATGAILNLPALCIMAIIGTLIALGIKLASEVNTILVIVKMAVIVLFIACGVAFISTENWGSFTPQNTGVFGRNSFGVEF